MEIITGTTDFCIEKATAVAIGKFDGIHIGHRKLLQEILAQKAQGMLACVFTFDPPPNVLFGTGNEKELTTRWEKRKVFAQMGVDVLVEFPLNRQTAAIAPEDFVTEILCGKLHAGLIAAGTDLSFGAGGAGDAALLKKMAKSQKLEIHIIDKLKRAEKEISSSLVREYVEAGDMPSANSLLGAPYSITGEVLHGNRIGRTIGMPTVNILPEENKLMPPCGVYYAGVCLDGKFYRAISNIGYRPTVPEKRKQLGVETYLYGYAGEAYGEEIEVRLYEFKRPEQKYDSLKALKAQLLADMKEGELYELPLEITGNG